MDRRTSVGTVKTNNLRGLKALVIGLGIMVVLGTALVIGVAVKRFYAAGRAPVEASVEASVEAPAPGNTAPPVLRLPVAKGAMIGGIAAVDGRLAVWVKDGPKTNEGGPNEGGQIMLIDPGTNRLTGTVALAPR